MKRPRHPARRIALQLLACLVLGAATTAVIAWAASLWERTDQHRSYSEWTVSGPRELFLSEALAHDDLATFRPGVQSSRPIAEPVIEDLRSIKLPRAADWSLLDPDLASHHVRRAGWPLRCLESECRTTSPNGLPSGLAKSRCRWALRFRSPPHGLSDEETLQGTVPLRPVALPFAANSAIFAVAWWPILMAISFAARRARRALRRRHGQCPACGYDLRGLAPGAKCPECGG